VSLNVIKYANARIIVKILNNIVIFFWFFWYKIILYFKISHLWIVWLSFLVVLSFLLLVNSVSRIQSFLSNADFLLSVWSFLLWFSSLFHTKYFSSRFFWQILILKFLQFSVFWFFFWLLSFYFKIEIKNSIGSSWMARFIKRLS